jgi:hypothetical protein
LDYRSLSVPPVSSPPLYFLFPRIPAKRATGVARWFICKSKIPNLVYHGRPLEWKILVYFTAIWYIL